MGKSDNKNPVLPQHRASASFSGELTEKRDIKIIDTTTNNLYDPPTTLYVYVPGCVTKRRLIAVVFFMLKFLSLITGQAPGRSQEPASSWLAKLALI